MIPVRDGVKLHAAILLPKGLPPRRFLFLMVRTPYGVDGNTPESINSQQPASWPPAAISSSLRTFEGATSREGTFAMMRPMAEHHDRETRGSEAGRRKHGRLRHGRVAREKCSQ